MERNLEPDVLCYKTKQSYSINCYFSKLVQISNVTKAKLKYRNISSESSILFTLCFNPVKFNFVISEIGSKWTHTMYYISHLNMSITCPRVLSYLFNCYPRVLLNFTHVLSGHHIHLYDLCDPFTNNLRRQRSNLIKSLGGACSIALVEDVYKGLTKLMHWFVIATSNTIN